jgi:hypothetical protein
MSGVQGYPTDPTQSTGTVGTSGGNTGTTITEDATTVASLNNAMRGMAGDIGNWKNDLSGVPTPSSASGTAYVLATGSQLTALADGIRITWTPDVDNTGAATLNVDTRGAKKLLHDSAVLVAGEIKGGHPVDCVYDASADSAAGAWLVLNPVVVASTFAASEITNDSGVTGADVGAALDQLDTDKLEASDIAGKQDTLTLISQSDAEAGTATGIKGWSALRVKQAIDALASGVVLGRGYTEYTAAAAVTTTIPFDSTLPQNTEGTEILSLAYTPLSSSSRLRCRVVIPYVLASATNALMAAMFNGGSSAVAFAYSNPGGAAHGGPMTIEYEYAPGTTSEQTISVRVGPSSGTMYINRQAASVTFGGASRATLVVEEVQP